MPFGFAVDVDLPVLLNAAERNPRPGRYDLGDVAALDAYTRPAPAAICVLAMLEVPPEEMLTLTLADVADDGATVTTPHGVTEVPAELRPYLHALVLARRFDGAADADLLLPHADGGDHARLRWVVRTVKVAETETGVRLAPARYVRKRLTVYDWLTAHGLGVRAIPTRRKARR